MCVLAHSRVCMSAYIPVCVCVSARMRALFACEVWSACECLLYVCVCVREREGMGAFRTLPVELDKNRRSKFPEGRRLQ